jgi:hypothetical protein
VTVAVIDPRDTVARFVVLGVERFAKPVAVTTTAATTSADPTAATGHRMGNR